MRLYEQDAYLWEIDAEVVRSFQFEGRPACILDRTIFYPEGGGQPSDRGTIGSAEVIEARLDGDEVVHILSTPIGRGSARCRVDAERRYDLMQQHAGQHLLSAILARDRGAATRSIHISDAIGAWDRPSTIDVEPPPERLGEGWIEETEEAMAAEIRRHRPISIRIVPRAEALRLGLRRPPPERPQIRVVEIEGLDRSACGGTHVRSTAEIASVAIVSAERYKGGTRISFLAGGRALAHAAAMRRTLAALARELGTGLPDVAERARGLVRERDALRARLERVEAALLASLAERLAAEAEAIGGARACIRELSAEGADPAMLGALARAVAERAGGIAAFAIPDGSGGAAIAIAAPAGAFSASGLLARALPSIEGRGGGSDRFAQGRGRNPRGIPLAIEAIRRAIAEGGTGGGS